MTETTISSVQTDATTPTTENTVETTPQVEKLATEAAQTVTTEATTEETADKQQPQQMRDSEGKFLPKHPRVEKLQTKINELTRQKHDASRELEAIKAEAQRIQQQLQQKPQLDPADFEGQQADLVRRAFKQEKLEDMAQRARTLEAQSQAKTHEIVQTQVEELREHIPDIDGIFMPPTQGGPMISPVMAEAIARTPNGALVAYHLMKNPREASRLYNADPMTALIEIGQIAAGIKPAPVRRVSQAPQPVQTVAGSVGNPSPDLANLSFKDYERVRNEQELAKRYP